MQLGKAVGEVSHAYVCFNPHPAFWPGATDGYANIAVRIMVSILTRPEGRVQRSLAVDGSLLVNVSILIRPSGRVQHAKRAGRLLNGYVSILTRPEGRVQPMRTSTASISAWRFQSSPGQKAGCNLATKSRLTLVSGFNPHPARRPGATVLRVGSLPTGTTCFNPHPARRPGATDDVVVDHPAFQFQSSPGQKAGCNLAGDRPSAYALLVSILTRPEGRVQPAGQPDNPAPPGFQSSPGQKAGCN